MMVSTSQYLLCDPELVPQITGDPECPGAVILKESVTQSPAALPEEKTDIGLGFLVDNSTYYLS